MFQFSGDGVERKKENGTTYKLVEKDGSRRDALFKVFEYSYLAVVIVYGCKVSL